MFNEGVELDEISFEHYNYDINKNVDFFNIEKDKDNFDSGTNNNDSAILHSLVNESMTENTLL